MPADTEGNKVCKLHIHIFDKSILPRTNLLHEKDAQQNAVHSTSFFRLIGDLLSCTKKTVYKAMSQYF